MCGPSISLFFIEDGQSWREPSRHNPLRWNTAAPSMSSWSRLHRPRICPYIRPSLHLNPTSFDNPFVSVRHAISLWRKFWLYSTMHAQYDSSFFFLGFQFNQSMRRKVAPVSEQVVVEFDFPCFPFNFFFFIQMRAVFGKFWQHRTNCRRLLVYRPFHFATDFVFCLSATSGSETLSCCYPWQRDCHNTAW